MALSENVSLNLTEALAQLRQLDRQLKAALTQRVDVQTTQATAAIERLGAKLKTVLGKQIKLDLSTVDASRKLTRFETQVKSLRKLVEKRMELNIGTSAATKAAERSVTNLTGATEVYSKSVFQAARLTTQFNLRLEEQAVIAKGLAADLRLVAEAQRSFNRAAANPASISNFGLADKQLFKVNQSLQEFLNPDISVTSNKLRQINSQLGTIGKSADTAGKATTNAVRNLARESEGLNTQLIATGRSLSLLFTLPTVVAAGLAAFNEFQFQETIQRTKVLTDAFTEFDATGQRVNLTAAQTAVRMGALRDAFNDIAGQTGQTPNDVARGFYFVASAGGAAATRLSILRIAAQGAAIGLGDVQTVADALTSVLNAYGEAEITAAQAGDILVRAVNDAKVEASELAPQLGRILPIASELGIEFAQVAEALALITQTGNSAQVAATQLRGILQTLIRPTSGEAAKILSNLGLTVADLREQIDNGGPTGLIDTLRRLNQQLTPEEFAKLFRRVDALNGALTLINLPASETAQRFNDIADAAADASTDLAEFERFAQDNQVLRIKQAFSQLLIQLQPLGQKVLPLVTSAVGGLVLAFDRLGDLLSLPFVGTATKVFIGLLAAMGPVIFALGQLRRGFQALSVASKAFSVPGGFGQFLRGDKLTDIAKGATAATGSVTLLGKATGALPGLFGLSFAAAGAFFAGSAIASDDTRTRILGLVGTLGTMIVAFGAARSAALAFGASAGVAGALGGVAALGIAAVAAFSAYREAVNKTRKAVEEFEDSLKGLTSEEQVRKFGLTLEKAFAKIALDDRVTNIELPELRDAMRRAGVDATELGQQIQGIVLANPDDLTRQRRDLKALADQLSDSVAGGRIDRFTDAFAALNDAVATQPEFVGGNILRSIVDDGQIAAEEIDGLSKGMLALLGISDETKDALSVLASEGLLEFSDGAFNVKGGLEAARAALEEAFGPDAEGIINTFAEAFRVARQDILDTGGAITEASNAAGSFLTTLDEDGNEITNFVSNVDAATTSVTGLQEALDNFIASAFGDRSAVTTSRAVDQLVQAAEERAKAIAEAREQFQKDSAGVVEVDETGAPVINEGFINFTADLTGPDGVDARQFIREQINGIDEVVSGFLSGPDADIELGLNIRELEIAKLAAQIGISVEQLNAFLATEGEGETTVQIETRLEALDTQEVIDLRNKVKGLIEASPLSAELKLQLTTATDDEFGALFASSLLQEALQGGATAVVNLLINAQEQGVTLDTLQTLFGAANAPVDVVKNVIFAAIQEGEASIEDIAKAIASIDPETRRNIIINTEITGPLAQREGITSRIDPGSLAAIAGRQEQVEFQIKTVLEKADEFEALQASVEEGDTYKTTVELVNEIAFENLNREVEAGNTYPVSVTVDPTAFDQFLVQARLRILQLAQFGISQFGNVSGRQGADVIAGGGGDRGAFESYAGGVFAGGGFRRFRAGGFAPPVTGVPREPMHRARVPSNRSGILFAEPPTFGESFVTYAPVHRVRAKAVLARTAKDFGMEVSDQRMKRTMLARTGAVMQPEVAGGSTKRDGEVVTLAREVHRLATVVEERETQPIIGEYHNHEPRTTDPRSAARYFASDVLKALR